MSTIAILSPGDMGHATGQALLRHGHGIVTCLAGRSERTRKLAEKAGFRDLPDLETMLGQVDLVLSILPPAQAIDNATRVAKAMRKAAKTPPYADCNAVAPETALAVGSIVEQAGAPFIDCGIIGLSPAHETTRFYVSGKDTKPFLALDGAGIRVVDLGPEPGKASALKMCYASLTKGTFTLHTAVLLAAEMTGVAAELRDEFEYSQKDALARMRAMVPRLPADSARWIGEMEEIAKTYAAAGVTPKFHEGAAAVFRLLAETPFASETRETMDRSRTLEDSVRVYAETLRKKGM